MIRLQDIAEMAGVSRTTVSNVINGNTKRVSQKTIDKITAILKEQNYVPHMGSVMLSGHGSRIIGVVLGFTYAHGMQSLQDPFVGERSRYIVVPGEKKYRLRKYEELLPRFLEAKALAFSSDYDAIEAMNFFFDKGIRVPDQISITGYDDSMYASMVRPKLTTVHQDVQKKAHIALKRLMKLIQGEELKELNIKSPVYLVKRDSVRE